MLRRSLQEEHPWTEREGVMYIKRRAVRGRHIEGDWSPVGERDAAFKNIY